MRRKGDEAARRGMTVKSLQQLSTRGRLYKERVEFIPNHTNEMHIGELAKYMRQVSFPSHQAINYNLIKVS